MLTIRAMRFFFFFNETTCRISPQNLTLAIFLSNISNPFVFHPAYTWPKGGKTSIRHNLRCLTSNILWLQKNVFIPVGRKQSRILFARSRTLTFFEPNILKKLLSILSGRQLHHFVLHQQNKRLTFAGTLTKNKQSWLQIFCLICRKPNVYSLMKKVLPLRAAYLQTSIAHRYCLKCTFICIKSVGLRWKCKFKKHSELRAVRQLVTVMLQNKCFDCNKMQCIGPQSVARIQQCFSRKLI